MMEVIVDTREPTHMVHELTKLGHQVVVRKMDAGDYETPDCIFERKTIFDLCSSMRDRLWRELDGLTQSANKSNKAPFVVVSGKDDDILRCGMNFEHVYGCICSIAVRYLVSVVRVESDLHAARVISGIITKVEEGKLGVPQRFGIRSNLKGIDRRVGVLASLLRVSARTARNLLRHFGSIQAVVNASEEDLKGVTGIGEWRAKRIRAILS